MRILYIDIDSMRPDHFGCYGYQRNTSPVIDAIAAEGICFDRLYAADTPCVPSRAAFSSGKFAIHHGALTHWGPGSEYRYPGYGHNHFKEDPVFPRLLRRNGQYPVSFASFADRHQAWWFQAGWREFHGYTEGGGGEDADEVNAAVLPWLQSHAKNEDWFLHVQYWDPHRQYTCPPEWMDKVEGPVGDWPDEEAIARSRESTGPFNAKQLFNTGKRQERVKDTMPEEIRNRADAEHFIRGYDAGVRYMDHHVGQLVSALQDAGVWEETAVIISADHGEALGEQGVWGDHCCAGEVVHRLPAIIRWPGVIPEAKKGTHHDAWVYNVDLIATITDLLGIQVPRGWDGQSFAAAVRGEHFDGRPHLVWSHGLYSCQRVVRTPRWQLRRTYHPGAFQFPDLELFDMDADPHETTDVSAQYPQVVDEHLALLERWHHEQLGHPGAAPDPMQEVVRTGPWKYLQIEPWLKYLKEHDPEKAQKIEQRLAAV